MCSSFNKWNMTQPSLHFGYAQQFTSKEWSMEMGGKEKPDVL